MYLFSSRGRIRTYDGFRNGLTVRPLLPLGYPRICLAVLEGFEPPETSALTVRWHTTCRQDNNKFFVAHSGFEPDSPT